MFVSIILIIALLAVPLLAAIAFGLLYLLMRLGWVVRPWLAMIVATTIMAGIPLGFLIRDRIEEERCRLIYGPGELMCGGELGGFIIFLFQAFLIIGALIIGPIVGHRTAKRFLARSAITD